MRSVGGVAVEQPQRQVDLRDAEDVEAHLGRGQRRQGPAVARGEGVDLLLDLLDPRRMPPQRRRKPERAADERGLPPQHPQRRHEQQRACPATASSPTPRTSGGSWNRTSSATMPAAIIAAADSV